MLSDMKKTTALCTALLVFGLVFSDFAFLGPVQATEVIGIINSNTTWTRANSPYTLAGPVAVNIGVTLTIEAGTTVNINDYYIQINGTLIAQGTVDSKITFTAAGQGSPSRWLWKPRLDFTALGSGSLENVDLPDFISIAGSVTLKKCSIPEVEINAGSSTLFENSITKLTIKGGSPTIRNNQIIGEFIHTQGSPIISGNTIHNKPWTRGGSPTFTDNRLNDGIHADSSGGQILIANNEINSKGDFNVIYVQGRVKATISNNKIMGNYKGAGIVVSGILSSAVITQNHVSNCYTGITADMTTVEITKNTLTSNNIGLNLVLGPAMGGASGEFAKIPYANVQENTITKNLIGLQIKPCEGSQVVNNNIYGNSQYDLKLQSPSNYTIANNYWGTTDILAISQKIFDNKNDFNLGHVTVTPLLTTPVPQYAPDPNLPIPTDEIPTQTPTPTSSPSTFPSQNPTAPFDQSGPQAFPQLSLNWLEVAILIVLIIIAVLLVVIALSLRKKRVGKES